MLRPISANSNVLESFFRRSIHTARGSANLALDPQTRVVILRLSRKIAEAPQLEDHLEIKKGREPLNQNVFYRILMTDD